MNNNLPITEELDFHYLLGLLPPLTGESEFAWLPELFSILSVEKSAFEKLIDLCNFCGGETLRIPTIDELSDSIEALQYFYDTEIKGLSRTDIVSPKIEMLVRKIKEVYYAQSG